MGILPINLIVSLLFGLVFFFLSCVGRWRIFAYSGHKGILSLVPLVNVYVYGAIAGRKRSAAGFILSGLMLAVSFSVLWKINLLAAGMPSVRLRASALCLVFIGTISVLLFVFYIRIVLGVCSALSLPVPLFTILALFLCPIAEFIAGNKVWSGTRDSAGPDDRGDKPVRHASGKTASLEPFLTEEDGALVLWDSGAIVIKDGIVTNTSLISGASVSSGDGDCSGG